MNTPLFFRASAIFDESAISDVSFTYRVPGFKCTVCGSAEGAYHLGFPHLDPKGVLSSSELRLIESPPIQNPAAEELQACIQKLETAFGVPVGGKSYFGPVEIKVTQKAKWDFDVLPITFDFFLRRSAAEKLLSRGLEFDYVDCPAKGKAAAEADLVQVVVPIIAHGSLPPGASYCEACKSYQGGTITRDLIPTLYESAALRDFPFFKTIDSGWLVYSSGFIEAAQELGLKGFIEGKTFVPMPVVPDPAPNRPVLTWRRPRPVAAEPRREKPADIVISPPKELTPEYGSKWIEALQAFLNDVQKQKGTVSFETGGKGRVSKASANPLDVLLSVCGGMLTFEYSWKAGSLDLAGGLTLNKKLLKQHRSECREWATDTWIAEEPEEQEIWLKAKPFAALPNGDYLALDGRSASDNPPVVYLNHEDSSEIISRSLAEFLEAWAGVYYVGPEIWVLNEYVDQQGLLDGNSAKVRELRNQVKKELS